MQFFQQGSVYSGATGQGAAPTFIYNTAGGQIGGMHFHQAQQAGSASAPDNSTANNGPMQQDLNKRFDRLERRLKETETSVTESVAQTVKETGTSVTESVAQTVKETGTSVTRSVTQTVKETGTSVADSVTQSVSESVAKSVNKNRNTPHSAEHVRPSTTNSAQELFPDTSVGTPVLVPKAGGKSLTACFVLRTCCHANRPGSRTHMRNIFVPFLFRISGWRFSA